MSKSPRKPPITVTKVPAGYGLRVGATRVRVFKTKEEAVDAARELARSGQGIYRPASIKAGYSRSFAISTEAKRVVRTHSGTTSASRLPPDSVESDRNGKERSAELPAPDRIEIRLSDGRQVTAELVQYMDHEAAKSRRKGALSGLGAVAGLVGAMAAAFASIMMDATVTSPGLDMTLLLGVASVAVTVATVLAATIPGLLKSRTKTNAWAVKVAGAVWDDEMAETGERIGRY